MHLRFQSDDESILKKQEIKFTEKKTQVVCAHNYSNMVTLFKSIEFFLVYASCFLFYSGSTGKLCPTGTQVKVGQICK